MKENVFNSFGVFLVPSSLVSNIHFENITFFLFGKFVIVYLFIFLLYIFNFFYYIVFPIGICIYCILYLLFHHMIWNPFSLNKTLCTIHLNVEIF